MNEWKIDKVTGRRFRMVGNIKEYEKEIHTTAGMFTAGEMQGKQAVVKLIPTENTQKAELSLCPFGTSRFNDSRCNGAACALFAGDGCILTQIGGDPVRDSLGLRCPFAGAACNCRKDCALYRQGCALTGIKRGGQK